MKTDQSLETIKSTGTNNQIFQHFVLLFLCFFFSFIANISPSAVINKTVSHNPSKVCAYNIFLFYLFLKYIAKPHWRQQKSEISHFSFFFSIRTLEGLFISSKHGSDGDDRPTNRPRNKKMLKRLWNDRFHGKMKFKYLQVSKIKRIMSWMLR